MKRICAILLAVTLLTGSLTAYATTAVAGDVNGDGLVNNRDMGALQQWLNDWTVAVDGNADVDGDGLVNNRDMGALQLLLSGTTKMPKAAVATQYVSLGAPAEAYYASNLLARCAWDMIIHDGRLYVGCGDYSTNSGDSPVLSCSVNNPGNWTVEAILPDEQIGRFIDFNGVLTIPGFDPVSAPAYGNYYELVDGEWQTQAVLPDGLHNFDIAWFEGRLYAAIGARRGKSPFAYTEDGVHYQTLPLYKDGKPVATDNSEVIRSSNLYVLGDELYADFWYQDESLYRATFEMYHYNKAEERFEYIADLKTATHGGMYSPATPPLWAKEAVEDKMFLTTGYLYYTTDFVTYTQVEMPHTAVVYDMMEYDGRLYILASHQNGKQYQTNVYSIDPADPTALRTEATINYRLAATSFAVDANSFFIGMGDWYETGAQGNGTILQVKR